MKKEMIIQKMNELNLSTVILAAAAGTTPKHIRDVLSGKKDPRNNIIAAIHFFEKKKGVPGMIETFLHETKCTEASLAHALNIHPYSVSRWIHGKTKPKPENFYPIACHFSDSLAKELEKFISGGRRYTGERFLYNETVDYPIFHQDDESPRLSLFEVIILAFIGSVAFLLIYTAVS